MSLALIRMPPGRCSRRRRRLRLLVATTVVWAVLFGWALARLRQAGPEPSPPTAATIVPGTARGAWFDDGAAGRDPGRDPGRNEGRDAPAPDVSIDTEGALSADLRQASDAVLYAGDR